MNELELLELLNKAKEQNREEWGLDENCDCGVHCHIYNALEAFDQLIKEHFVNQSLKKQHLKRNEWILDFKQEKWIKFIDWLGGSEKGCMITETDKYASYTPITFEEGRFFAREVK